MIDFVTIIFHDMKEINLLKLQAVTFNLVDKNIINKIYVLFNDAENLMNEFKKMFFSEIIHFYPDKLHEKIILISINEIGLNFVESDWFTQQIVKIEISKYINSKYYVVLDGKNHFKERITYNYFFNDNKPILHFNTHGDNMLNFYNNCLNYFNVECPLKNNYNKKRKIQTTTPFIFITEICHQLINYIKNRENLGFDEFIYSKKLYTEFFFYYAYLIHSNLLNLYYYNNKQQVITVGYLDPNIYIYNSWENKINQFNNKNIKVIALHRKSFQYLDTDYKNNLKNFYMNHFKSEKINEIINNLLK